MRTCCGRMLKFIRCVRNKFASRSFLGDSITAIESNLTTKKCIADALFLNGSGASCIRM